MMTMTTRLSTEIAEYEQKRQSGKGRTRHVFDDSMCAHIWATQSQSDARNKQGNFYFTGATIFSYGAHFPIARHVERNGEKVVLFTTRDYSSTTSGHKRIVGEACRHLTVIYAFDIMASVTDKNDENHRRNLKRWDEEIPQIVAKLVRSKTRAGEYQILLNDLVANANSYCKFFGLRRRFEVPAATMDECKRLVKENEKREVARVAAAKRLAAKRLAEQRVRDQAAADAWLKGEGYHFPYSHREDGNVRLRVNGEVIETSLGAEVPLKHALKILPLVRSGKEYKRNGHTIHLGHFTLDEITADGRVVAGCHTIRREEIERVAATIGA